MSVTAHSPTGVRTVLLASPRSFCAGVERAIAIVEQLLDQRGGPIYVRRQIVHNIHVVTDLQARGAGASAPPRLVDAVIAALAELGPVTVIERETTHETVHFTLPTTMRRS